MKKIFSVIIFMIMNSVGVCQNNYQLPDSNAIWRVSWGTIDCFYNNWFADYQYIITGDSLINSINYHKIERSGLFSCLPPLSPVYGYMGAYRNSLNTNKVYFIPADSLNEQLLYDFNLFVGDTIKGYLRQVSSNIAVIDSIDSTFNGNEYRKTWYYSSKNNFWNGRIIEGIGCDHGLLEGLIAMLENNGDLVCFSENEQTIYPVYSPSPCDQVSSIHDKFPATQNTIIIAPNPSSEFIRIQSLNGIDVDKYLVYDITGKIITNGSLSSDKIISISHLNVGLYFLELFDKKSILVQILKIVKINAR